MTTFNNNSLFNTNSNTNSNSNQNSNTNTNQNTNNNTNQNTNNNNVLVDTVVTVNPTISNINNIQFNPIIEVVVPEIDPASRGAQIGGRIFLDANGNGVYDSGEEGINGIDILLVSTADNITAQRATSTFLDGQYLFTGLPEAAYQVRIDAIPEELEVVPINVGTNDTIDSDFDPVTGRTSSFFVLDDNRTNFDLGLYDPRFTTLDPAITGEPQTGGPGPLPTENSSTSSGNAAVYSPAVYNPSVSGPAVSGPAPDTSNGNNNAGSNPSTPDVDPDDTLLDNLSSSNQASDTTSVDINAVDLDGLSTSTSSSSGDDGDSQTTNIEIVDGQLVVNLTNNFDEGTNINESTQLRDNSSSNENTSDNTSTSTAEANAVSTGTSTSTSTSTSTDPTGGAPESGAPENGAPENGLPENVVSGTDGDDKKLNGTSKDDLIFGEAGNDHIRGKSGNDILIGDGGKDKLVAGKGDDVLVGTNDVLGGIGEKDSLVGGKGADAFILGTEDGIFYVGNGKKDRAFITDFSAELGDKVQLFGSADLYSTKVAKGNTELFAGEGSSKDLIAVFKETEVDLTSDAFEYVG